MATFDLNSRIDIVQSLPPAARTASVNGAGVDLRGFNAAVIEVCTGVITDGTHTLDVQESDDNVTFTSVAATDLLGTEPTLVLTDDNVIKRCGYIGTKRYIRVAMTLAGTTTGGIYGVNVIRGRAELRPVA